MTLYHYYAQVVALDGFILSHANGSHLWCRPIATSEEYGESCRAIRAVVMDAPEAVNWPEGTVCNIVSLSRLN